METAEGGRGRGTRGAVLACRKHERAPPRGRSHSQRRLALAHRLKRLLLIALAQRLQRLPLTGVSLQEKMR